MQTCALPICSRAAYWFDDCGRCGVDAGFFFLGNQSSSAAFNSSDFPTITRPIYAPNLPGEFGEIVAHPDGTEFQVLDADPRRVRRLRPFVGMAEHLPVEAFLVAEMVVHGGDVRPRTLADVPHGGVMIAGLGKHRGRRLQEGLPREIGRAHV